MQDLARFDRCGGRVGVDELGKPCDEVTCNLDADLDSITVTYGSEGSLDLPTQVQCDPIRSFGRVQRSRLRERRLSSESRCVRSASVTRTS